MAATILNTVSTVSSKTILTLEDPQTITGQKTFDQLSFVPFIVEPGSATVPNLDADKLDGAEGATYHDAALLVGEVPVGTLTNMNANNLTSGTVPDARFPAILPAVNGSKLTGVEPHLGLHEFWMSARGMRGHGSFPHGELTDYTLNAGPWYGTVAAIPFGVSGLSVCQFQYVLPASCQIGVLSWTPYFFTRTSHTAAGGFNCSWSLQWSGWEHGESLNADVGAGGTSAVGLLGADILTLGPNVPCAPTGSEAKHSMLKFLVYRNAGVDDTYAALAYLIGIRFTVNLIAGVDGG